MRLLGLEMPWQLSGTLPDVGVMGLWDGRL